jgi:mRNA interferase RelE/StbE
MKSIDYSREAIRSLQRMPTNISPLIRSKIEQYADDPASLANNVLKLQNRPGYRLRLGGDWRVIFIESATKVEIVAIRPRGGAYE